MAIQANFEVVVGGCVDESKPVLLAFRQCVSVICSRRAVGRYVRPIDEDVLCAGWSSGKRASLNKRSKLEGRAVIVVGNGVRTKVIVVV